MTGAHSVSCMQLRRAVPSRRPHPVPHSALPCTVSLSQWHIMGIWDSAAKGLHECMPAPPSAHGAGILHRYTIRCALGAPTAPMMHGWYCGGGTLSWAADAGNLKRVAQTSTALHTSISCMDVYIAVEKIFIPACLQYSIPICIVCRQLRMGFSCTGQGMCMREMTAADAGTHSVVLLGVDG